MPQVTVTKIVEAESHVIVRVSLVGDVLSELNKAVLLSPSDLNPIRPNDAVAFRLTQVWYGLSKFDVTLGFNTLLPYPIWTLAQGTDSHTDFRSFGGLMDYPSSPPGVTDGKLWISTLGFTTAGAQGSLVLELRKAN